MVTLIKGSIGMGAQRWITLGFIKFQPSEIIKLFLAPFIVYQLHSTHADHTTVRNGYLLFLLGIIGISALLVRKQPDLGTAILLMISCFAIIWAAGLARKWIIAIVLGTCLSLPIGWKLLKPYQKQRIAVFLGEGDATKERYQREQAIIAVGSGGLWGKGFLQGTQIRLSFLPEGRTDFIFAVLCEEWGFVGAIVVLALYFLLFARLLFLTWSFSNFYQQLLCFGLWIPIFFSAIINMCMVLGMLPIVGIPLPFMSYGISNLWTSCASLGWIQSIHIKRNNP
jgi:rod shape determining protein RodA